MVLEQLRERVVADDIAVEDEEESFWVILAQDLLCEFEGTCSAQGLSLLRVGNLELVLLLEGLEGVLDVMGLVVDGDHYFHDAYLRECLRVREGILRFDVLPWAGCRRGRLISGS
jgi:hypothetical protein